MRALFFGTPAWAVPSLEALVSAGVEVVTVVANPDRPTGRRKTPTPPPVKLAALAAGLPVLQPQSARAPELIEAVRELRADVAAVVAYGRILPPDLLAAIPHGFVNLHFSLLPRWRGAAPVQHALMAGDEHTGACTIRLTEGMDEGPLLRSVTVDITPGETSGELGSRLAEVGAPLLVESLHGLVDGRIEPVPQDETQATYAPKLTAADVRIDWRVEAAAIERLVRGANPEPMAWTMLGETRVRIMRAAAETSDAPAPGRFVVSGDDLLVGTGRGAVRVTLLQKAGARPMSGAELARGLRSPHHPSFA